MHGFESVLLFFSRRALQEQVAAINAASEAAETAHARLSTLHTQALSAAFDSGAANDETSPEGTAQLNSAAA